MSGHNALSPDRTLTDFQQVMRQWSALAPYNAVHLVRISGAPDPDRWRAALATALRPLGVVADLDFPIESSPLTRERKIAAELNAAFSLGDLPLRPFVLSEADGSHWFGVTFDHWVADSRSIRALLQRVYESYSDAAETVPPLHFADPAEPPRMNILARASALSACAKNYVRHRRAHRVRLRNATDFTSDFLLLEFPVGAVGEIRAAAKKLGATVNDLFVAAAGQVIGACSAHARRTRPGRFLRSRRDRIAIGIAVDLHPGDGRAAAAVFGFALGYFSVVLDRPEEHSLEELTAAIARDTRLSKRKTRTLQLDASLGVAQWLWNLLPQARRRAQIFQKSMPLVAAISNVNLTGSWADQPRGAAPPAVLDYLRVSPSGPLVPIVFTLTTIGDRLSLGVTFRTTAFKRREVEQLAADFINRLCFRK